MLGNKEGQGTMHQKTKSYNADTSLYSSFIAIIAITTILCPSLAFSKGSYQIQGQAYVIDGDTIVINDQHIRLYGIDAPEKAQICDWGYNGHKAIHFLDNLVKNKIVYCAISSKDRFKRPIGVCSTSSNNLNEMMVSSGHAFAYRHYSQKYTGFENAARKSNIGIWRANCENPYLFRRRNIF